MENITFVNTSQLSWTWNTALKTSLKNCLLLHLKFMPIKGGRSTCCQTITEFTTSTTLDTGSATTAMAIDSKPTTTFSPETLCKETQKQVSAATKIMMTEVSLLKTPFTKNSHGAPKFPSS